MRLDTSKGQVSSGSLTRGEDNIAERRGFKERHLLLDGGPESFRPPEGDGRVPPPFFGRTVPLLTVGRKGSAGIIGLAVGHKHTQTCTMRV